MAGLFTDSQDAATPSVERPGSSPGHARIEACKARTARDGQPYRLATSLAGPLALVLARFAPRIMVYLSGHSVRTEHIKLGQALHLSDATCADSSPRRTSWRRTVARSMLREQTEGVIMSDRSLRGMRLGAQSMETESGVEPAPRQRVEYRCEDGEQVFVTFSSEAEIPPVWVSKTGKEALLVDGERPVDANEKAVRTHWDMLLERRSLPELEQILEDRLNILRERRGERRSA